TTLAEEHLLQVLTFGHDRKPHVAGCQLGEFVDDLPAFGGQWFGLRASTIPDGYIVAGLDQAFRHGQAHAAGSDPTDLLRILRHPDTLPLKSWRFESACAGLWPFCHTCGSGAFCAGRLRRTCLWCAFKAHYPLTKAGYKAEKGPRSRRMWSRPWEEHGQMQDAVTAITADHAPGRSQATEPLRLICPTIFSFIFHCAF